MPYAVSGLFEKRTDVTNLDMWDFLGASLQRHSNELDLVVAGGDQCYSDGVATLNIWQHLNRVMRKEDGQLLPDEETMLSWYRDIYRGYWGFESVRQVFDSYPVYMIWDDHETGDGWGSYYFRPEGEPDGLRRLLPDYEQRGLSYEEGRNLMQRMFRASRQVYNEYRLPENRYPEIADVYRTLGESAGLKLEQRRAAYRLSLKSLLSYLGLNNLDSNTDFFRRILDESTDLARYLGQEEITALLEETRNGLSSESESHKFEPLSFYTRNDLRQAGDSIEETFQRPA